MPENAALLQQLHAQLHAHGTKFLCAFSGGLDSTVLLHAAARLPGIQLRAIHIHHGLHADADQWAEQCARYCRRLNIDLLVVKVDVKKNAGKGIEAAARNARYEAIAGHIGNDEILLTAHHKQDQAETVLLRLLRGSGVQGLAAMRASSSAHGFRQLRPLLSVSKAELQAYAADEKLGWTEDPSNQKSDFDRNFLRHEIMPRLEKRWPQAVENFSRSAQLLDEEHQCLREQSEVFLAQLQGIDEKILSLSGLLKFSRPWRAQILRAWCQAVGTPPLPANILQEIEQSLLTAKPDAHAQVKWAGTQLARWRDCLYLSEIQMPMPLDWQQEWDGVKALTLPNGDQWCFESSAPASDLATALTQSFGGNLLVRQRQGGEKILLENCEHHAFVKNCLQELGIPPWERRRLPLVFSMSGDCLAVGNVLLSARFEAFCRSHGASFTRIV